MKNIFKLAALPFVLAACAHTGGGVASSSTSTTPEEATQGLSAYHWLLSEAKTAKGEHIDTFFVRKDLPVQLDFAKGRYQVSNLCNNMSGEMRVNAKTLHFGQGVSTRKMCEPPLMQLDEAVSTRLRGDIAYLLQTQWPIRLTLTLPQGEVLVFTGKETAATRYGGEGETIFLEVAAERKPCQGGVAVGSQCLQVRELKYDEKGLLAGEPGPWQHFYQNIEGYTHEPGVRNILRLKRYRLKNQPADASSAAYVLDMVVSTATEKK